MGYTHAGGVDAPLSLFKTGGFTVVPYHDWRGTYDVGTCPTTRCDDNVVYFPQKFALSFGDGPVLPTGPPNWYGEIIGGQADGSGYQYKRNRYYDPRSGRFTQEDPIGLAGGLNSYGFAGGNPISFSDPFGLCHTYEDKSKDANCVKLVADLRRAGAEAAKSLKAGERNVFEEAAAAFEATDREVKYVARDDGDLNRGGENTDKDPSTNALGRTMAHSIKIGNFLGVGDRLATAAHEIVVHGAEKNGLIFIGDALPTTPQTNQLIWSQLTPAAKQTAKLFMLMPGVSP